MSFTASFILAGAAIVATVVCGWLGARPARPLEPPRLAPWRLLMLAFFAIAVAALGHLVAMWRAS